MLERDLPAISLFSGPGRPIGFAALFGAEAKPIRGRMTIIVLSNRYLTEFPEFEATRLFSVSGDRERFADINQGLVDLIALTALLACQRQTFVVQDACIHCIDGRRFAAESRCQGLVT